MISGPKPSWTLVISDVPQRPILLNFFTNDLDNETECTLIKSVHKLGVANTPNGRVAIYRDLDWVKNWAEKNLMKLNKMDCKVPHLDRGDNVMSQGQAGS